MLPYIRRKRILKQRIKFFEIGLGCNVNYSDVQSIKLWQNLFHEEDEIWMADNNV